MNVPVLVLGVLSVISAWLCGNAVGRRQYAKAATWAAGTAVILGVASAIDAAAGQWPAAAIYGAGTAGWAWIAWKNWRRRKRKRSLKALGHRARARLAAMLRSMPKPGPALRPVPQGARA